jgi:hypothetical protein
LQSAFFEKMAPSFNIASRQRTERFERTVMREQGRYMLDSRGRDWSKLCAIDAATKWSASFSPAGQM